jgi:hypothetical protein
MALINMTLKFCPVWGKKILIFAMIERLIVMN